MDGDQIRIGLERVAPRLVDGGLEIAGLTRLSGGASQETWRFEAGVSGQRFILRRSPLEGPRNGEALPLALEAQIMKATRAAGVPVPEILHLCQPEDGLGEGFIMAFIAGETVARKILRDPNYENARATLTHDLATSLSAIHKMALDGALAHLPLSDGADQLRRYTDIYRGFGYHRPVIELAIKWLKDTMPPPLAPTLVHGDFRLGNFIVDESGLGAILDWELTHLGDPREDLGWICVNSWRFGQSRHRIGGFGDLAHFLDVYQRAGGSTFAQSDIKWFQGLGSLKWAIMCLIMYDAFQTGRDPSVERALIGRRTSEAEIDLLNLIEDKPYA